MMIKKLLSILVISLLLSVNGYSEEIILRCIPKITSVKLGDKQIGDSLFHRVLYAKFKEEFDLTKSEKPIKSIKKVNLYLTNERGKKDKFSPANGNYSEEGKIKRFDFEDIWETKKYKSYYTLNINFDGGSWVASGNHNSTEVIGDSLSKTNFSWFGKCYNLDKKQFKKPLGNDEFLKSVS